MGASLLRSGSAGCLSCHPTILPVSGGHQQRRSFIKNLFGGGKKNTEPSGQASFLKDILNRKTKPKPPPTPQTADLSPGSLFNEEEGAASAKPDGEAALETKKKVSSSGQARDLRLAKMVLDPNPRARELWQRKKVIQMVKRKERLTHEQFIKRTEREITVRSQNFKTSKKKLGMLSRQIQGKTVDEAIVQMRFSKKKVAQEVRKHLEYARDKAIVSRGMGLKGVVAGEQEEPVQHEPIEIVRDGKRYMVKDRSNIYIDQSWIGAGPMGQQPDYRARGRVNIMRTPWTHISVQLKEETSLVRKWQEKEDKKRRQRLEKVWVPLPDRPIYGQNQYYTW